MKITKYQLLIRLAKLMFYVDPRNSVAGDFDFLHKLKVEFEEVEAIYNSLKKDELEIDGYERVRWTRVDPNDESTYPQRLTRVIVCDKDKNVFESFVWIHNGIREFAGNNVTHWRPLPPPPGKEEAK